MAFIDERPKDRFFNRGDEVDLGNLGIGKVIIYQADKVSVLTESGCILTCSEDELVPVD